MRVETYLAGIYTIRLKEPTSHHPEFTLQITTPNKAHTLTIGLFPKQRPPFSVETLFESKQPYCFTTDRDIADYPRAAREVTHGKCIEIGAGLGGLVLELAQKNVGKITVIDPLDYNQTRAMLLHAQAYASDQQVCMRISTLLERCRIMHDKRRVRLINTTLGNALETHPELLSSADFVIDNFGAVYYVNTESFPELEAHRKTISCHELQKRALQEITRKERALLNPQGKLIQCPTPEV